MPPSALPSRVARHNSNMNMMVMNSNSSGSCSFLAAPSSPRQRQQQHPTRPPQLVMDINVMQPLNNTISNNFGAGFGAMSSSTKVSSLNHHAAGSSSPLDTKKLDPFAGLGF